MTVQELVSLLIEEKRRKEKLNGGDQAFSANTKNQPNKAKRRPCGINHVTADCQHKGKSKCDICEKFGHKEEECWRNPLNKGKGRVSNGWDRKKPDTKGKERANVTKDDLDSDTESLDKAFTIKNGDKADKSSDTRTLGLLHTTEGFRARKPLFQTKSIGTPIPSLEPQNLRMVTPVLHPTDALNETLSLPTPMKTIKGLGNKPVTAYGTGTVTICSKISDQYIDIRLCDVIYVPEACGNLLSLGHTDGKGEKLSVVMEK
ncbi:hypothetical protein OG21DRAFT_1528137 [Imleria badia]|nr:hypothetical protein OG21DRAFT_1528137 [Imleria badia]